MAQELSGGCYGLSHKFMHWQEELLLGGMVRDPQGQLLRWGLPWELAGGPQERESTLQFQAALAKAPSRPHNECSGQL